MKKLVILFLLVFMITGCTVVRIDTSDIDNIINIVLSKENKLYNQVGKGYKYYIPRGVTYIDTDELNDKLYSGGYYYYLYIDAISYYHQTNLIYKENKNSYYSKNINVGNRKGYLQIDKYDNYDNYLVQFVYNYAKIETIVKKDDINKAVLNCSYILSTIKFNNNVIKLMLNDDYLINKDEKYDIFTPKNPTFDHIVNDDDEVSDIITDKEKEEVE